MKKLLFALSLLAAVQVSAAGGSTTTSTMGNVQSGSNTTAGNHGAVGPCEQIKMDCQKNGYFVGGAGKGHGMWWDCLCPLIAQNFPEPGKNLGSVPSDQGLVPACRQHPHGQQIMTKCAEMAAKKAAKQQSGGSSNGSH